MTAVIGTARQVGVQIGYARVSTTDQNPGQQVDALKRAGCTQVCGEIVSGKNASRAQLERVLAELRPGDTLVVWKLDRLGRSLRDLLTILESLQERGIHFRSLTEHVNTSTPAGTMLMQTVGVFAQFERAMIVERTQAGLKRAKAEGRRLGGRPKLGVRQQRGIC